MRKEEGRGRKKNEAAKRTMKGERRGREKEKEGKRTRKLTLQKGIRTRKKEEGRKKKVG